MKKVIAAVVGAVFAVASLGTFAAGTQQVQAQASTKQVVVHKVKAKKSFHHVKAKKKHVRHAKKAPHSA